MTSCGADRSIRTFATRQLAVDVSRMSKLNERRMWTIDRAIFQLGQPPWTL